MPAGQPRPERDTAMAVGVGPGYFAALRVRMAPAAHSPPPTGG